MKRTRRGRFITIEGGEGAGKSTLVRGLSERLEAEGRRVVATREPGGAPGAEAIRALLVSGEADRWDPIGEALLLAAARREHVRRTIRPALEAGAIVLCDRFTDSTRAYQGFGHGVPEVVLDRLQRIATGRLRPSLTLILDIDPRIGLKRAARRRDGEDRFEGLDLAFHDRLRAGFRAIAAAEPRRCRVIDAAVSADDILTRAWLPVAALAGLAMDAPHGEE